MTHTHSTGRELAKFLGLGFCFGFFPLLLFVWVGFSFSAKSAVYTPIPVSLLLLKIPVMSSRKIKTILFLATNA